MAILIDFDFVSYTASGAINAGGSVAFYDTGTATPKTVYSDAALTTPLANPFTLDNAGRFAGPVYAPNGERYAILERTSGAASIRTRDPVWGVVEDPITDAPAATSYTPSHTGAVSRTVQSKLDERVTFADFGAVGDGLTDDATAIQAALNYGGKIFAGKNVTHRCDSVLTFGSDVELDLNGSTLDFSNMSLSTAYNFLSASGSEGAEVSATGNVAVGATSITVAAGDESAFTAGQWARLGSDNLFDASSTSIKEGELVQVESTASGTINLVSATIAAYTTANSATIAPLTMVDNVCVKNGRILGPTRVSTDATHIGLLFKLCVNPRDEDMVYEHCNFVGVRYEDCAGFVSTRAEARDAQNTGNGYGVSAMGATQDGIVRGLRQRNARHAFTTNNSTSIKGVVRRVQVEDSISFNTINTGDAFDTHTAAEDIVFLRCKTFNSASQGFNVECRSGSVIDCQVYDSSSNGISLHNESDYEGRMIARGNKTVNCNNEGILVLKGVRGTTAGYEMLEISGNDDQGAGEMAIYVGNSADSTRLTNVRVSGNKSRDCQSTSAAIRVDEVEGLVFTSNQAIDPAGDCFRLRDCINFVCSDLTGRLASSSSDNGLYLNSSAAGLLADGVVNGISIQSPSATASRGIFIDTNVQDVTIGNSLKIDSCTTPIQGTGGTGMVDHYTAVTGGTGSAGAGNQYVELTVGGTTYRVLHDGTV